MSTLTETPPTEEEESPTSIDCASCGSTIEDPESGGAYWHEDFDGDVCWDCYHDNVDTCVLCGDDDLMPSQVSPYILVKHELAQSAGRPPGIFRILSRPFLSIPLIGSGSMHDRDVAWIDRLPQPSHHYDISGHICRKCAAPYERTWKRHYQYAPRLKPQGPHKARNRVRVAGQRHYANHRQYHWYPHDLWHIERARTRRALRQHPEILRDIEHPRILNTDTGYECREIRDLERLYSLRIRCRTWHEWLAFEHQGVKIYGCYSPSTKLDSWLLLTGDPAYRSLQHYNVKHYNERMVLLAYCLPTYPRDDEDRVSCSYRDQRICKQAIIDAIEQGFLTQNGVTDREGKPVICR